MEYDTLIYSPELTPEQYLGLEAHGGGPLYYLFGNEDLVTTRFRECQPPEEDDHLFASHIPVPKNSIDQSKLIRLDDGNFLYTGELPKPDPMEPPEIMVPFATSIPVNYPAVTRREARSGFVEGRPTNRVGVRSYVRPESTSSTASDH